MAQLVNTMNVEALFNEITTTAVSTVTLEMGSMTLLKTADKNPWTDGVLTYTVTLRNIEEAGNITEIEFSDTIDVTKSQLLPNTVTINGTAAVRDTDFTYNETSGLLEFSYETPLPPGETVTIIFQVRKV